MEDTLGQQIDFHEEKELTSFLKGNVAITVKLPLRKGRIKFPGNMESSGANSRNLG